MDHLSIDYWPSSPLLTKKIHDKQTLTMDHGLLTIQPFAKQKIHGKQTLPRIIDYRLILKCSC